MKESHFTVSIDHNKPEHYTLDLQWLFRVLMES